MFRPLPPGYDGPPFVVAMQSGNAVIRSTARHLAFAFIALAAAHLPAMPQGDVVQRPHWADQGDSLIVAVSGDADGFLPIVQQLATGGAIMDLIMPSPTESTFEDGHLEMHPSVAERFEFSDDRRHLTYWFRKDLRWTDGHPITARDMAFAYELYRDPVVGSPRRPYTDNFDPKEPWTLIDDYTIRFNFKFAYNRETMLAHAGLTLVPEHLLKNADRMRLRSHPLHIRKPVGHGPFVLTRWRRNQEIVISRWPGVKTTPVPYLRRIIFKIVPEYQTQLTELETGKIDMMETVQEKDFATVRKWGHVRLYRRGFRFLDYVAWNLANPLFKDRRVRRALTMSIDIPKIIATLLTFDGVTHGIQAYSTFTPELKDYYEPDFPFLPYDPEKAKKLFAEAGWRDSDGDGILDKDGRKFEFTLVTNTGNPRRAEAVQLIERDLKKVGVIAHLDYREPVTFFEELRKRDYEAALAGWSAGLFPDPSDIWMSETKEKPRPFNFTGYSNPKVDELIRKGLREPDKEKEARIWKEMNRLIYEDQPYTFLYWKTVHFALHKRFRDVQPNILSVLYHVYDWWVPKAEHKYKY